jgi:hypothetical protein
MSRTNQINRRKDELGAADVPLFLKLTADEEKRAGVIVHKDCRGLAASAVIASVLMKLKAEWFKEFQRGKKASDSAARRAASRKAPTKREIRV